MRQPNRSSRRAFLQSIAAAGVLAASVEGAHGAQELLSDSKVEKPKPAPDRWRGLKVGVASYSLRGLKLDDAIAAINRVGLQYVSIKDVHLAMDSTPQQRNDVAAKFKAAGITPLSVGVVRMENDEAKVRAAFEYARDVGVPTIVCNPHLDSFPILDKLVKQFDIKLAIHNHGPESDRFKSPLDAMNAAEKFDERIGVCVDVGHTARMNQDPAEVIRKCAPRLYDVHLKDVAILDRPNNGVEFGLGVLDIPAMLRALLDIKFAHHVGVEFEKDANDVLPGLAGSVGFLRGVMWGLSRT